MAANAADGAPDTGAKADGAADAAEAAPAAAAAEEEGAPERGGDAAKENGGGAQQAGASQDASFGSKHDLQHKWNLWVHQRPGLQKGTAWSDTQLMVHEFGTVEDFWCMFNYSYPPSKLDSVDYSLFKNGVTPAWEDPNFKSGGRWVVKLEKVKAQSLDDLWLTLSLALIGEAFLEQGGELVCGAIVSVRSRASKIALWLSAAKDEKKIMAIGKEYRNILASTPHLQDLATKELTFEDFKRQAVTYVLPRPYVAEASSAGVFQ